MSFSDSEKQKIAELVATFMSNPANVNPAFAKESELFCEELLPIILPLEFFSS